MPSNPGDLAAERRKARMSGIVYAVVYAEVMSTSTKTLTVRIDPTPTRSPSEFVLGSDWPAKYCGRVVSRAFITGGDPELLLVDLPQDVTGEILRCLPDDAVVSRVTRLVPSPRAGV